MSITAQCTAVARANQKTRLSAAKGEYMDYRVIIEAAWLVRDVATVDDAIGVAISEAGSRLNDTGLDYVEVNVGVTGCPSCGEPFDSAFLAAETAIVGLDLEIDIFNAESVEHARRIAKGEIGRSLTNVPLSVLDAYEIEQ